MIPSKLKKNSKGVSTKKNYQQCGFNSYSFSNPWSGHLHKGRCYTISSGIKQTPQKSSDENKLLPKYNEYVLSKEPANFQEANNLAVALWRTKNPEGIPVKPKTVFAIDTDFGLSQNSNLSNKEKEICTIAQRNNRNNGQSRGFSN